jgi:nitrite reductase/ring-hydroxylating ferredoxin subunit
VAPDTPASAAAVPADEGWIRAADLPRLQAAGRLVFTGADRPIVLFAVDGKVLALDNRCPHMGFPLSRGELEDGTLVCHWHHARFDLRSGCAFDLWADDVPVYETRVVGEAVYVRARPRRDPVAYWRRRLEEGVALNLPLVMVKAVHALRAHGVPVRRVVAAAGLQAAAARDAFGPGLVTLTAMAHVAEEVPGRVATLALAHGVTRAAADAAGAAPHRPRRPLERHDLDVATATRWLRRWTRTRHRDGAERTLATLLAAGRGPAEAAVAVFSAATDRVYADAGHTLDFANKAFELAELVGWEEGGRQVLPGLIPGLVGARGAEESVSWRSPVDLIALAEAAEAALPEALRAGRGLRWPGPVATADLAAHVLGEDPRGILDTLLDALRQGCPAPEWARAVAHAAALRLARFGPSNELDDWDTALHTFTYCQAAHHAVVRCGGVQAPPEVLRAVLHGALSVYQDRFLNVPPARLPEPRELEGLPAEGGELLAGLLEALDRHGQTDTAVRLVARYLELGLPPEPLVGTLAEAVVREDAAFHTLQALEAGLRLWRQWEGAAPGRLALVALARYAAAHAPTQRAFLQTVQIVERLQRGEALYGDEA